MDVGARAGQPIAVESAKVIWLTGVKQPGGGWKTRQTRLVQVYNRKLPTHNRASSHTTAARHIEAGAPASSELPDPHCLFIGSPLFGASHSDATADKVPLQSFPYSSSGAPRTAANSTASPQTQPAPVLQTTQHCLSLLSPPIATMSDGSSSPPDGGWTDEASASTTQSFSPERVQSILDSRNSRPSSFLSLFYGDSAKTYRAVITRNLQSFQSQVLRNRPLTDQEIGALTDHWGASANVALTGKPAAMAVALFFAWRGRGRFRFPFWQPKWVNTAPDVFPNFSNPLLQGRRARFAWHTGRLAAYGLVCSYLVTPLFLSYAGVRATVSISSDPRLQEAIKESVKDIKAQKTINHMQKRTGKVPTQFPPQERGGQPSQSAAGAAGGGWGDDASPQSTSYQGNEPQKWDSPREDSPGSYSQAPRTYGNPRPQQQAPPPPPASENPAWGGDDSILEEIDEASPVAPAAQPRETPKRPQKQSRRPPPPSEDGVSAWERVREQAQSEQNDDSKR